MSLVAHRDLSAHVHLANSYYMFLVRFSIVSVGRSIISETSPATA